MTVKNLHNWSVVRSGDPYTPPELREYRLNGITDYGIDVLTSAIVDTKESDRTVTTYSGSVYCLCEMNPEYANYLISIGKDPNNSFPKVSG